MTLSDIEHRIATASVADRSRLVAELRRADSRVAEDLGDEELRSVILESLEIGDNPPGRLLGWDGTTLQTTCGSVTLGSVVGWGAFGVVYEGLDHGMGMRRVVVKLTVAASADDADHLVNRERTLARLCCEQHLDVATVHAVGIVPRASMPATSTFGSMIVYTVMQQLGMTPNLEQVFTDYRAASAATRLRAFRDLAFELSTFHLAGVCHLDVHPGNVVQDRFGKIRLIDLGLSALLREVNEGDVPTKANVVFGAPELLKTADESIGPWTDVFSVGVMLYQAFVRNDQWDGESPLPERKRSVAADEIDAPGQRSRRELAELINRSRCWDHEKRKVQMNDGTALFSALELVKELMMRDLADADDTRDERGGRAVVRTSERSITISDLSREQLICVAQTVASALEGSRGDVELIVNFGGGQRVRVSVTPSTPSGDARLIRGEASVITSNLSAIQHLQQQHADAAFAATNFPKLIADRDQAAREAASNLEKRLSIAIQSIHIVADTDQ